jgi:hypothetical protein
MKGSTMAQVKRIESKGSERIVSMIQPETRAMTG